MDTSDHAPLPRRKAIAASLLAVGTLLAACSTPTLREPPQAALPPHFHHEAGWLAAAALGEPAAPSSAPTTNDSAWWQLFDDPVLDRLLQAVGAANPDLEAAAARLRQAEAGVAAADAEARPWVDGGVSATRSGSRGNDNDSSGTRLSAGLTIGWSPDLWGRIALARQAARADSDASAADLAAARLALELNTALRYVRLRTLERQRRLLLGTLDAYQRSLQLTRNQYDAGFVARADVIQAETQLQSVRTQLLSNRRQHVLELNSIAELTGVPPSELVLVPAPPQAALPPLPAVPRTLPSSLLVRRPDLAAAQRRLAAANARIGIAETAWLPDLGLSASASLQADRLRDWLEAPIRVWSLGPALAATLFDGGARRASIAQAEAAHDALAAQWRGAVLQAMRETEDALASLAILSEQAQQQATLVALAAENLRVVENRYQAGVVSFLEVATAQNLALDSQRNALEVQAEQLIASMELVAALGGGWRP